jgi:glycosyltransferase involved in cell wall biosynthesis
MSSSNTNSSSKVVPLPERDGISAEERQLAASFRDKYSSRVEGFIVRREVPNPRVSLVVISFRAAEYLLDCLRHLCSQTVALDVPYEIVLADSGGLDHLRDRYKNLVDVDLRLEYGLPLNVARNAAMGYARGEFVAIIDDDGLVAPDWVEQALEVFRDASIGAARGRIIPHKHRYFNTFAAHYDRGLEQWDEGSLSVEGNMMIRRELYLKVGGFPDEFYGSEGLFLGYLLDKSFPDKRSVYAPGMVMRHDYCRSMREFIWKCRKYRTVSTTAGVDDPGFVAYRQFYSTKFKPQGKRTPSEKVARALMLLAQKVIVKVSLLDHVKRR